MENEKILGEKEVKEEKRNSLAVINTDLFGESKAKRVTSLDLSKEEDVNLYLASQGDDVKKLNDSVGSTFNCIGFVAGEFPKEDVNQETGEIVVHKKHSLCLFDDAGNIYVTGSSQCYRSFVLIASLKGYPTREKPLRLEVIKVNAKTEGHKYLKVQLAK